LRRQARRRARGHRLSRAEMSDPRDRSGEAARTRMTSESAQHRSGEAARTRSESAQRSMRWVWRGVAVGVLVIGWLFIAWQNHFHVTGPMVFVCLGFRAAIATIYNLWRTGAAAVDSSEEGADSTWAKPVGALGELEREKRTLLKAIKEAEFDHQMGKLSQRDVDDMIRMYRARAIEVIKEIEQLSQGAAGTPREQIMREVRARLELDAKAQKKVADK